MEQKKILIVAGGTGGHVFPGIAVARELIEQGHKVFWLGTKHGLDAKLVPQENIPFHSIPMLGLRGKGLSRKISTPFRLLRSVARAVKIMRNIKPDVVLGMGGYVTAPAGIAAKLLRKKLVIHEQNAIAGMANRYLAKFASVILQAFPKTFPDNKNPVTVGNPVRKSITELASPTQRFAEHQGKLRLLVVGGSLGAQAINQVVPELLSLMPEQLEVYHQTGETTFASTNGEYQRLNVIANVVPFIDDMTTAYQWADIVLCRAGALTISELAAAGLASILVPLPIAVDDHQTKNAYYLTEHGAGILLPQAQLSVTALQEILSPLISERTKLLSMAEAARELAMPQATEQVASFCTQ